jgi:hypothetical protein
MKDKILTDLKEYGFCIIENFYSDEFCDNSVNDIEESLVKYKDKIQVLEREDTSGDERIFKMDGKYETAKMFANEKDIRDAVSEYYGSDLKCHFTLAGKVTYKEGRDNNSGGGWHKDQPTKQLKSLVYLSDVDSENGPYLFIKKSNNNHLNNSGKSRFTNEDINVMIKNNNLELVEVTAKKGTVIITDTSYIHRGKNIEKGTRYSYTNYFLPNDKLTEKNVMIKWGKNFI